MLDRECLLHAWVIDYAKKLAVGIDEDRMAFQPAPGLNTPLWIYGHLAMASDFAGVLLGAERGCPKAWHLAFRPGTDPAAVPQPHPTKQELIAALEANHARVVAALKTVTPEQLAKPNTYEFTKAAFPTVADMVANLLTTHPMLHLGQLSVWRRLNGLPAVLGF